MRIILSIFLILVFTASAFSQVGIRPSAFYADFASFKSDSAGLSLLEIYYQIYTSRLSYIQKDGKYQASYNVNAIILKKGKQIDATEIDGKLISDTYKHSNDETNTLISGFQFFLEPGKYEIQISLNDLNAETSIPLKTDLEVPDFQKKKAVFSNIQFIREINADSNKTSTFQKNGMNIVPSASRRYGDGNSILKFYYEFYKTHRIGDIAGFIYRIEAIRGRMTFIDTVYQNVDSEYAFFDSISLANYMPGGYSLQISTLKPIGKKPLKTTGKFNLYWSALEMVRNDFETAILQLNYIASGNELDNLRKAPKENRIKVWNEFWKKRDPSPGSDENELKNEYYRRISQANTKYSIPMKDGWETDMGMIYIVNGEPDDIERHVFSMETKPYEIWYYYDPRRRFLFIDSGGYGEYELQYPRDGDVTKQIDIEGGSH